MPKVKPVIISDSDTKRNVVISVDTDKGATTVFSGFSAWENLAFILEALAVTAEQCIQEGMPKKIVYQEIQDYFVNILENYQTVMKN